VWLDELTFGVWKRENPNGRVLRPDEKILAANKYESANWEDEVAKIPVRIGDKLDNSLEPRTLIVGVTINGKAKAYPFSALQKQSPILDNVGGTDIVILLGEDKKSVRAFERMLDGKKELKKVAVLKDYWFDWKIYNPNTQIYALGSR